MGGRRNFSKQPNHSNASAPHCPCNQIFGFDRNARTLAGEAVEDVDHMIFRIRGKDISGKSAIEVVRALERDDSEYRNGGGPIRQYLIWSLNRLNGSVPPRDLDLSDRLEDEPLALGYLLLLDEYGVGKIVEPTNR